MPISEKDQFLACTELYSGRAVDLRGCNEGPYHSKLDWTSPLTVESPFNNVLMDDLKHA